MHISEDPFRSGLQTLPPHLFFEVEKQVRRRTEDLEREVQRLLQRLTHFEARQSFSQAEEQIRHFADAAPVMIWTSGRHKLCVYVNRAWLEFTGKSLDQEMGSHWAEGVHPEDLARCEQAYGEAFDLRTEFKLEYRLRRWDGEYRWILDHGRPWFQADGAFAGFIGSCIDITDRIQLEQQLRQSQKMEALGQLAAGVAHDFNNILTIIQGHTELLLAQGAKHPQGGEHLQQISAAADRAANLTRQLLTFSRRQIMMQPRGMDLNETAKTMMHLLRRLLGEQITLRCELDPQLPQMEADPGMVEQVIMNLAVNARDAMPRGGQLVLRTSCIDIPSEASRSHPDARPGRFVRLSVCDSGNGMETSTLVRIFEPFFTTKEAGKGTGLGLSTVYGIVKMHHGWIEVQSQVGQGTTFDVFFPCDASRHQAPMEPDSDLEIEQGDETILVVEDEPGLRSLVRQILEVYGYSVIEAASGDQALHLWRQHRDSIDLVLTDLRMPGSLSGLDLKQQLLQDNPRLKIICTSGYSAEMESAASEVQNNFFLAKPYQPQRLAQMVRACLDATQVPGG